jgi:predicted DNA-binding transcriptional regulator YafY
MDEFYRVPFSSAEVLATLAAVRVLEALAERDVAGAAPVEPGVLESAAERMAAEVPDFVADQAAELARTVLAALARARFGVAEEADDSEESGGDAPPFPVRRTRRLLEDAFEHDTPVEIEYFVASRGQWTTRRLEISDVYEQNGGWYVSGHCGLRDDFRQFRLDHIRSVRTLDEAQNARNPFVEE